MRERGDSKQRATKLQSSSLWNHIVIELNACSSRIWATVQEGRLKNLSLRSELLHSWHAHCSWKQSLWPACHLCGSCHELPLTQNWRPALHDKSTYAIEMPRACHALFGSNSIVERRDDGKGMLWSCITLILVLGITATLSSMSARKWCLLAAFVWLQFCQDGDRTWVTGENSQCSDKRIYAT